MEMVNTMRDLLHLNPLYGEQFRTLLSLSEFKSPRGPPSRDRGPPRSSSAHRCPACWPGARGLPTRQQRRSRVPVASLAARRVVACDWVCARVLGGGACSLRPAAGSIDLQDMSRLVDAAASLTSADDQTLQQVLEQLSVPERCAGARALRPPALSVLSLFHLARG